jgi:hypothetical protein
MSSYAITVDLFALALMVAGFHLVFRQALVRRWWRALRPPDPQAPPRPQREQGEDPAHYALAIFGMMLFAFALIMLVFTTAMALMA